MNTMNTPGFTAEVSLYHTSGQYHASQVSTAATQLVVPQWTCPCPPALFDKASSLCHDPIRDWKWCAILDHCMDCIHIYQT